MSKAIDEYLKQKLIRVYGIDSLMENRIYHLINPVIKKGSLFDPHKDEIIKMIHEGKSYKEIATEFGSCEANLRSWIRTREIDVTPIDTRRKQYKKRANSRSNKEEDERKENSKEQNEDTQGDGEESEAENE